MRIAATLCVCGVVFSVLACAGATPTKTGSSTATAEDDGNGGPGGGNGGGDDDDDQTTSSSSTNDSSSTYDADLDRECELGAQALCVCFDICGQPSCTQQDMNQFYDDCMANRDEGLMQCIAGHIDSDYYIACSPAYQDCGLSDLGCE